MGTSRLFRIFTLSFLLGVWWGNYFSAQYEILIGVIFIFVIIGVVFPETRVKLIVLGVGTIFLGIIYYQGVGERSLINWSRFELIGQWLWVVRDGAISIIYSALPEPYGSLLGGIILGTKSEMSYGLKETFKITGLTHIIAISGYNVAVVIGAVYAFFKLFPHRVRYYLTLGVIGGFIILTGASGSVVRAGIMATLAITARYIGRKKLASQSLVAAALLMVVIKPSILVNDIGFQLSVAATYGLIEIAPRLEQIWEKIWWLKKWPSWLKEAILASLAAQIMTLPIIFWYFSRISFISPIANILVVPIIPLVMGLGFAVIFTGLISLSIGKLIAWLAWLPLYYIVKISKELAKLPYASVMITNSAEWLLVPYYVVILWWVYKENLKSKVQNPKLK